MRRALLLVAVSACTFEHREPQPPTTYPDAWVWPDIDGGSGNPDLGCASTCIPGNVCARTGECLPTSDVRTVHAHWTIGGQAPTSSSCTATGNLVVSFLSVDGEQHGYAPVPCQAGIFTIDRMPTRFDRITVYPTYASSGTEASLDASGNATVDL